MFFVLVAAYLLQRRIELRRRAQRSWIAIVERLRPGLGNAETSSQAAADLDQSFSNEAIESSVRSRKGRREIFRGAGAMMEMADYAERNGGNEVAPMVANLRSHATAIRVATANDALRIPTQDE